MLTTFGIFWSVEGAGADWPGSDAALLGVLAFVAALVVAARACCCDVNGSQAVHGVKRLAAFGRFWWDFVIGDDWLVAVRVVIGDRRDRDPRRRGRRGVVAAAACGSRDPLALAAASDTLGLTRGPVAQLVRAADS